MMLLNIALEVMLAEGNFQSFFFDDYKKARCSFPLDFVQQRLLVQRFVQNLFHRNRKDVKNNHNTLLELTFLSTSISFKVTLS